MDVAAGVAFGVLLSVAAVSGLRPGGALPAVPAPSKAPASPAAGFDAAALSVIDGDTIEARVAAFPGAEIVTRVRLAGVDAPERRARCAAERDAAEAATTALEKLVAGRRLRLTEVRGDKYFGRVTAKVATAEAGDLAGALISAGHGRAYRGGRRVGWC